MAKTKKKAAKKTAKKKAAKKSNKGTKAQSGTPTEETAPIETDSTKKDVVDPPAGGKGKKDDKDALIAEQKAEIAKLKIKVSNQGIPTKKMPEKNKKLLRNGERLAMGFELAMRNKDHTTCTEQELQGVEYEIRKLVKLGGTKMVNGKEKTIKGGFKKGLSDAGKERAKGLLEFMGRKELTWDLNIVVLGMENA